MLYDLVNLRANVIPRDMFVSNLVNRDFTAGDVMDDWSILYQLKRFGSKSIMVKTIKKSACFSSKVLFHNRHKSIATICQL